MSPHISISPTSIETTTDNQPTDKTVETMGDADTKRTDERRIDTDTVRDRVEDTDTTDIRPKVHRAKASIPDSNILSQPFSTRTNQKVLCHGCATCENTSGNYEPRYPSTERETRSQQDLTRKETTNWTP